MLTLDHVLVAVKSLDAAKAESERLGYNVVYGGSRKRALNALIFLRDGTCVELVGQDRFPALISIMRSAGLTRLLGGMIDRIAAFPSVAPGLFNISLYASDLQAAFARLRAAGVAVSKPRKFTRKRDDGVKVSWELVGTVPYDLPFIIGDYTPGRLSHPRHLDHPNGAEGIACVTIACRELDRYEELYQNLLSQSALHGEQAAATFLVGDSILRLVASSDRLQGFTASDPSRPLACTLRFADGTQRQFPANAISCVT